MKNNRFEISKVYAKGQIVVPVSLRKEYGIDIGDTVKIVPEKGYLKLMLNTKKSSILKMAGILNTDKKYPGEDKINNFAEEVIVDGYRKEAAKNKSHR